MRTLLASFLLAVVSITVISCQHYSAGLQKGSNRAEETSAIGALRTIAQAQTTFSISNAGNYGTFEQLAEGGFLDSRFHHSSPALHGYVFNMQVDPLPRVHKVLTVAMPIPHRLLISEVVISISIQFHRTFG